MPTQEVTEAAEYIRTKTHRKIAMGSFIYMAAQGTAITASVIFSGEREAVVAAFTGLTPLLIATNAMFVSVVLAFFGASTLEKVQLGK